MEIVENSTVGDYVPDIIRGVDYSDFLEVYKDRNLKEAITELTSKLATGEKLLGYDVDETSKKINSMIFNTVQEAKWQVKNNIRARIMDYKEN